MSRSERIPRWALGATLALAVTWGAGAAPGQERVIKSPDGAEMVLIPAGAFAMGSSPSDIARAGDECRKRAKARERAQV